MDIRSYADRSEIDRDTHFLHHAWPGYRLENGGQIQAGINQVPFGVLPFNSHSYFFSLAYYVGLEDDYDLGVKVTRNSDPWRLDLACYPRDEGHLFGYTFQHDEQSSSELGLSLQAGRMPNDQSGGTGSRMAAALHWDAMVPGQ